MTTRFHKLILTLDDNGNAVHIKVYKSINAAKRANRGNMTPNRVVMPPHDGATTDEAR